MSAATSPSSYLITLQKISAEYTEKNCKHRKCKSNRNAILKIFHLRNEKGCRKETVLSKPSISLAERSRTSCVPALLIEMSHPPGASCPVHEVHLQSPSSLNLIHYAPHASNTAGFCSMCTMPTHPGNSHLCKNSLTKNYLQFVGSSTNKEKESNQARAGGRGFGHYVRGS